MTTDDYRGLTGTTPEEKLASVGIVAGSTVNLNDLATAALRYGIAVYLFFEKELVRSTPLEVVIHRYKDVPEFERPYVRIESFFKFIGENNDPAFDRVMQEHPIVVEIVKVADLAADPAVPPLVYVVALMPFTDEIQM